MSKSVDLVTFGETMIRLSPPNHERLEQTSQLDAKVGGSELNTAVAAARLGLHTQYVTRLTLNPLGKMIRNKAREHGVDTSEIVWTEGDRIGTYYVEFGASPRANSVGGHRSVRPATRSGTRIRLCWYTTVWCCVRRLSRLSGFRRTTAKSFGKCLVRAGSASATRPICSSPTG